MNKKWQVSDKMWTLDSVRTQFAKMNTDTRYQRQLCWTARMKSNLIHSVLDGYDIGKIYLHENRVNGTTWDVIDGKQRLTTIIGYVNGEFKIRGDFVLSDGGLNLRGLNFGQLPEDTQDLLLNYTVTVCQIATDDNSMVINQFVKLQVQNSLSAQEIRWAPDTTIKEVVIQLLEHPMWKIAELKTKKGSLERVISQILFWEYNERITEASSPILDVFYINHHHTPISRFKKAISTINKALNKMKTIFPDGHPFLRQNTRFTAIYSACSFIDKEYNSYKGSVDIGDMWIKQIHEIITSQNGWICDDDGEPSCQWGAHSANQAANLYRLRDCTVTLLALLPMLTNKDNLRDFTQEQRLSIWMSGDKCCAVCGKELSFDNWDADHIMRHTDGGKTTVENGRVACQRCNRSNAHNE